MIFQDPLYDLPIDSNYKVVLSALLLYCTLTVFGLITVVLFIVVLIKGRFIFKEYPFFVIVWQLTLANLLCLVAQAISILPCAFLDAREGELYVWYKVGAHAVDLADYAVSFFAFLMAVNRFAVFVLPQLGRAFTKTTVYYSVAVTWFIILCLFYVKASITNIETHSKWSLVDFFIRSNAALTIVILIGYLVPLIILLIYVLIYIYIRKRRSLLESSKDQDKNDLALLWQGFIVALSLIFFRTINTFAPRVEAVEWIQWLVNIVRGMTSIVNHTLNPILFLTTNKTVRRILHNIIRKTMKKRRNEESVFIFGSRICSVFLFAWVKRFRVVQNRHEIKTSPKSNMTQSTDDLTRWTKRTLEWIPREAKRPRGRPPKRWADVFVEKMNQLRNQLDTVQENGMETRGRLQAASLSTSWMTLARQRNEWRRCWGLHNT